MLKKEKSKKPPQSLIIYFFLNFLFNLEYISSDLSLAYFGSKSSFVIFAYWIDCLGEMTDPIPSLAATQSFLSEDVFQNEQSRRLFEAIDELRSCGANHEIDLPEVSQSLAQNPSLTAKSTTQFYSSSLWEINRRESRLCSKA